MDAMPMAGIDGARAADVSGAYAVLIDGGSACRAVAAWALPSSLSLRACSLALPTRGSLLWGLVCSKLVALDGLETSGIAHIRVVEDMAASCVRNPICAESAT